MNKIRRLFWIFLPLLILSACQSQPAGTSTSQPEPEPWETAQLFLSYATSQGSQDETLSALNERMLQASGGLIYCNTYAGGRMGGDEELMQAVRSGSISVIQSATSVQAAQIPELALLDTPYLFSSVEACNSQLNGALMDFFQPCYNREGLQLLAWRCPGFRQLSSSIPVERASDLKKLKIRILDNPYHRLYWLSIGAEPVNIPFSNLFYAIQQGMVNAQENPPNAAITLQLEQLHQYLILTDYLPFISAVVMNKDAFDQLSPEQQQIVAEVFQEYCDSMSPALSQDELETYFTSVLTPGQALQTALMQGVPAVKDALREDLGEEITDRFYSIVEKAELERGVYDG